MSKLIVPVNANDHHLGNMDTNIILVEYGDFQCPYCGRAHPLVKRLLQERGHDVHFVFRHFPLRKIHPHAFISAVSAEAAGQQGLYWEMHDGIFENQRKITPRFLTSLAEEIGLNSIQFDRDSKSEALAKKVEMDFESGIRSGVNSTPTFFINSLPLLSYDESYESLAEAIEDASVLRKY